MLAGAALCAVAARAENTKVSLDEFRASVQAMQSVVADCAKSADACDVNRVSGIEEVGDLQTPGSFEESWQWLRDALVSSKKANAKVRAEMMSAAETRLEEMLHDVGAPANATNDFAKPRAEANRILAGAEFNHVVKASLLERFVARVKRFLGSIFEGVGKLSESMPWLGTAFEYLLIFGAAVGLLFFVFRSFSRQQARMQLGDGAVKASEWEIESSDWASLAETCASEGRWREAVHGLYWAAILHLESRRAWRHNPTRTPREYVRLLRPGSAQRAGLRGLTQMFERVWYGLEEVDGEEYRRARTLFDDLSAASTRDAESAEANA